MLTICVSLILFSIAYFVCYFWALVRRLRG